MPFDLTEHMRAHVLSLKCRHGEVLVRTSWWRRFCKTEEWVIAYRPQDSNYTKFHSVITGEKALRVGELKPVDDPDLWPDEVCAEVARLRLTQ